MLRQDRHSAGITFGIITKRSDGVLSMQIYPCTADLLFVPVTWCQTPGLKDLVGNAKIFQGDTD